MSDDSLSDDAVPVEKLPKQNPISPPPDGGREAWGVVIGGFLVFFVMFGLLTAFGTFQAYYATNQLSDWTESDISWIGSIQVFLTYACVSAMRRKACTIQTINCCFREFSLGESSMLMAVGGC